jgi:uncharacterized membrane protein
MVVEEEKKPAKKIIEVTGDLIETYRKLITINVVEHGSTALSFGMIGTVVLIFGVITLIFLGIGLAWWIGETMNNMKAGFFIIGSAYALIILLVLATASRMIMPGLRNLIIRKFYEGNQKL